ncbi:hypothetical protein Q8A67_021879 [Cirrhinus molitorella]|uniref:Uncharacterized protein n=1 Tax=Cirrhinus molitorella TaxID=172907 RepID=A0AA88PIG4_9TELE|nr:hypothetical protein Q8A67_021879 [Cirrhinus molitorella]
MKPREQSKSYDVWLQRERERGSTRSQIRRQQRQTPAGFFSLPPAAVIPCFGRFVTRSWLMAFSLCLELHAGRCLPVASSRLRFAAVFTRSVEVLLALAISTRPKRTSDE